MSASSNPSIVTRLAWNQYLSNCRATTMLLSEAPHVKTVNADDLALKVLSFLLDNKISSAPVWDEEKKEFIGSVCLLDLVILVTGTAAGFGFIDADVSVGQVRASQVAGLSMRNPWRVVSDQAALIVVMDLMASEHIHRLAVMRSSNSAEDKPTIAGYITETTLARFIFDKVKEKVPVGMLSRKVSDFHMNPIKEVVSINQSKDLRRAFDTLWTNMISAICVVNDAGAVVGTVSASDLKHLPVADLEGVHAILRRPISEFLQDKKVDKEETEGAFFFCTTLQQVTCSTDDTIELLLSKFQAHRVHRLWVVDGDNKPIGVISLTDIIGELQHIRVDVEV